MAQNNENYYKTCKRSRNVLKLFFKFTASIFDQVPVCIDKANKFKNFTFCNVSK